MDGDSICDFARRPQPEQIPPLETCPLLTERDVEDRSGSNPRIMPRQWLCERNLIEEVEAEREHEDDADGDADGDDEDDGGGNSDGGDGALSVSWFWTESESGSFGGGQSSDCERSQSGSDWPYSERGPRRDDDGVKVPAQPIAGFIDFFDDNGSESDSVRSGSRTEGDHEVNPFDVLGMAAPQYPADDEGEGGGHRLDQTDLDGDWEQFEDSDFTENHGSESVGRSIDGVGISSALCTENGDEMDIECLPQLMLKYEPIEEAVDDIISNADPFGVGTDSHLL